ncbi:MAG TPA: hypothetical protein VEF34_04240, partial [Syntrophobacteraceae bacterium]|nr:hypothetical protein [Syntrophobacteraceae bacterium]
NDLYPQLISAGYDPKTSDAYARIVAAQQATRAEYSEGTFENAWEAYRKSRWVVRGEGEQEAEAGRTALHQRTSVLPWPEDFPNATIHTTLSKLTGHPDHAAAKAGDTEAALRLVRDLAKPERMFELGRQYPDATVVPIHAVEESGRNKIPRMYAQAISDLTGLPVDEGIGQNNISGHTKKGTLDRLLSRANFTGKVQPGRKYVILDDAISSGGTVSELRHYIENNGGKVVAVTGLAAGKYATRIPIRPETVKAIERKFGREQTEELLRDYDVAGKLEALTEREGRYILSYPSLDSLGIRIHDEGYERGRSASEGTVLPGRTGETSTETEGGIELHQRRHPSRTIPTSETLSEEPISLKDIKEYEDLQKEAARRAWAQVEKEHGRQVRIDEKALRSEAESLYRELPSTQALDAMRRIGLKRSSLDDWDQDTVTQLVKKFPTLIRKDGGYLLDELAHDYGYETEDALIDDLLNPQTSKGEFIDRYVREAIEYRGEQLGLTPEEWQRRLLEKEQEVFAELTKSTPDARLDQIRKKMGSRASLVLPSEGYGTGPHIINLFALKDRSSFLHEALHIWLEELIHDSAFSERAANNLSILKGWWASHADEMHSQFLRAKKDAEAALRANPDDPQAQARVDTYRKAAEYLGQDIESGPKFFGEFARDLGLDMDDSAVRMALMTPLHELFTRHGEAYFMEGRAPSPGLQSVFDAFRMWLKRIYERVAGRGRQMLGLSQVAGTPIEVSPEVRGVMDRIIATDEQIETMRQQQRLGRLFKSAEDAGMTSAEWKAYNKLVARSVAEARAQVQRKAMAQLAKQKSGEWAAKAEELRPEVEGEINGRSDLQVLHYLRTGKLLGAEDTGEKRAPVRMDQRSLENLIGRDNLKNLPYGLYMRNGGVDPQALGEMFGYRSGSDMVQDLLGLEAQRRDLQNRGINLGVREHLIQEALSARLRDHFGDMLQDGSMPQQALDAVHNEQALQALSMELRTLIRQSGQQRPVFGPAADARVWAREAIGDRKVWEVTNLNRYARDEAKAAAAAEGGMLKGDLREAIAQKRSQILSHALYVEAKKVAEALEGLEDRADRYGRVRTIKSMDQAALDQIHTLLERFGLKRADPNAESREVLSDWLARQWDMGADVKVADSLFNPNLAAHYKDLTVSQMRDLSDAVKSIAHVGRETQKITVAGKKAEFAATVEDLVRAAYSNVERRQIPSERNPEVVQGDIAQRTKARWTKAKSMLAGAHASLSRLEQELIDRLDGGDSNGPWNQVIFRRIKEARAYENRWREEMTQGVRDLVKAYPKEDQEKLNQFLPPILELIDNKTGQPTTISKAELVSLALNWGNESNRSKMCRGEGWKPESVQAVLDRHMSRADWDFVQGVWDLIERMRPEIAARERRMTGVEPVWVDAATVYTPYGEYRGGYYPMV